MFGKVRFMLPYRFCTLYSGSTGNAAYLETPHARILIDAGRCAKTLTASLKSIGVDVDTLDAVVVTHDHKDHVSSLQVLTKKHPIPVHILLKSAEIWRASQPKELCSCLVLYNDPHFSLTIGDIRISAFPTPHDSRASVGFRFDITDGIETCHLGYATDIGYVSDEVRQNLIGCESVILESNHDENMLLMGPYTYELKMRIKSQRGHLSNRDCADFAADLAASGTHNILLAHLSEQNNYPDFAYDESASACAGLDVNLLVASPIDVTMLVGDPACPIPKQPICSGAFNLSLGR